MAAYPPPSENPPFFNALDFVHEIDSTYLDERYLRLQAQKEEDMQGFKIVGLGAGTDPHDAARIDQIGGGSSDLPLAGGVMSTNNIGVDMGFAGSTPTGDQCKVFNMADGVAAQDGATINNLAVHQGLMPISSIVPFAGIIGGAAPATLPTGWLFCDGEEYDITSYPLLADALDANGGTAPYNVPAVSGATKFRTPNLNNTLAIASQTEDGGIMVSGSGGAAVAGVPTIPNNNVVSGRDFTPVQHQNITAFTPVENQSNLHTSSNQACLTMALLSDKGGGTSENFGGKWAWANGSPATNNFGNGNKNEYSQVPFFQPTSGNMTNIGHSNVWMFGTSANPTTAPYYGVGGPFEDSIGTNNNTTSENLHIKPRSVAMTYIIRAL